MDPAKAHKDIENQLKLDKIERRKRAGEPKVLILGSSDSGKSTLLKQLQIIHGNGFTEKELEKFKLEMYRNIIGIVVSIVKQANDMGIWASEEEAEPFQSLLAYDNLFINLETQNLISSLWKLAHIQNAVINRQFELQDTAPYFLSRINSLCDPTYVIKNENILHIRQDTRNVTETIFNIFGERFHFFDVSGHRKNRKFWVPFFDDVHCIIFITAISAYDQCMVDGESYNYMSDSLTLFGEICANKLLSTASKIVFLNKYDLFKKKVKVKPIQQFFPDAPRSVKHKEVADYFRDKFTAIAKPVSIGIHTTVSTDSNAMTIIVNETLHAVLKHALKSSGL